MQCLYSLLYFPGNRCRLRQKSWKNPGRIFADNSVTLDSFGFEGLGSSILSDLVFEVLDGKLVFAGLLSTAVCHYVFV